MICRNNIKWHKHIISHADREKQNGHKGVVLWFTGLSGSGKSTLAGILEQVLYQNKFHTYLIDGDNIRHGLSKDLGFNKLDRKENIRRVGEVAKLMVDAGLIVITALISPYSIDRQMVRNLFKKNQFIEIFVDTSLTTCKLRDTKKLYEKAYKNQITNFTGVNSTYELPEQSEIYLDGELSISHLIQDILIKLHLYDIINNKILYNN